MSTPQRDMLVSGKYRIMDPLGAGGMGAVFSATHVDVGRKVALKFLKAEVSKTPGTVARFRREAAAAGSIGHENILEVFDVGESDDGTPFIVMELLEGESLARILSRETRLPAWRAAHVAAQLLSALGAAHHRGIVHRDLKPENVFLTTRAGHPDFVKVLDFGISAIQDPADGTPRLTQTGDVLGTPPYMAPEQARGEPEIDHRADLWAAGVVLFEMVTGRLPFPGQNGLQVISKILSEPVPRPSAFVPDLPTGFEAVILKALEKDKGARFQSAADFYERLVPFLLEGASVRPAERTPVTPVSWTLDRHELAATRAIGRSPWARLGRPVRIAAATAAVLLSALAIMAWLTRAPRPGVPAAVPAPAERPPAETVDLLIAAVPAEAEIRLDGALAEGNPASLRVPRGTHAVRLQVTAPGYAPVDRWLAPDRDRSIDVALVAVTPPAPPADPPRKAGRSRGRRRTPAGGGSGDGTDIFTTLGGSP